MSEQPEKQTFNETEGTHATAVTPAEGNTAAPESKGAENAAETATDSKETTFPAGETESAAPAEQPSAEEPETAEAAPTVAAKGHRTAALALDTFLVLLLAGTLGSGIWYLNRELAQYRVPSPMEIAAQQNIELCRQREALQAPAYHADEQLHMRKRLSALVRRSEELKRQIEDKKQVIETQHQKVLAIQHDIRQEDKTFRSVAKGLLPGMAIGDATTTTGKTYRNAVIRRLEGGRITLRMPEGQTTFPVNTLVKENLPDFARYAFGLDDMVDMSDFEIAAGQPAPKARKGKLIPPQKTPKETADQTPADYEPTAGAPVVDTDANKTTTWTGENEDSPEAPANGSWQPPTGDLPF